MLQALVILFVFSVVFGAVVTPAVYALFLELNPALSWPFSRVFDRAAMVGALIICLVLRRRFGWRELREAFLEGRRGAWVRQIVGGMVLTGGLSFAVLPFVVGTGELDWRDRSVEFLVVKFLRTVPTALFIALIEESFFRVLVFRRLASAWRLLPAMVVCSCVYAVVHFIAPVKSFVYPGFSPWVGFEYISLVIERILLPGTIFPFIGLFMVGMILCYVMLVTRSIYLCIGLHAGWIMAVKMALHATQLAPGFEFASPFEARYFLVSEPAGWMSIALVGAVLYGAVRRKPLPAGASV